MPHGGVGRGPFRRGEDTGEAPKCRLSFGNLLVSHRNGGSAALSYRLQDEVIAEGVRYTDPAGDGLRVLPTLGVGRTCLEGTDDRGAARRLDDDKSRPSLPDPAELRHLRYRLPHADDACSATGRVDDHIGAPDVPPAAS